MIPVQQWLQSKGFIDNPFDVSEADSEPFLQRHFIHAIWFDDMCGKPQRPRSTILFADRGHGKSACRREIARICGTQSHTPALIVEILDYEWLLAEGWEQVTLHRYMQYIVRVALQNIVEMLNASEQKRQAQQTNLLNDERLLVQFAALLGWTGVPDNAQLPAVSVAQQNEFMAFYRDSAQATDILKTLVELIKTVGYASIYILIDRVDEHLLTENDPEAAIRLIHPLISSLPVLEYPGIAFKFFLPRSMRDLLYAQKIGRIGDRIRDYVLRWSNAELLVMLTRRLEAYSPIGDVSDTAAVHSFDELCESSQSVDDRLVETAQASPRQLIELARQIVLDHCQMAEAPESKIPETILSRYLHAVPLLHLDARGDIWLDNKRQDIRLTKLPRCLLELLWEQRHRYVSEDEIHSHLYPDAEPEQQRGKDALYKLVRRLRDQLEPDCSNSKNYVDYVHGRGYRLCNFEDDATS